MIAFFSFNQSVKIVVRFTLHCVTIVQQRMSHFYYTPQHSVKLVKLKRVENSIVLYNSECHTFCTNNTVKHSKKVNSQITLRAYQVNIIEQANNEKKQTISKEL